MWNRRREEEPPKPIAPPPPSPPPVAQTPVLEPKKEMKPVSSMPVGRLDAESRGGTANIGKAVRINGDIHSEEDLYVDGNIQGKVEALKNKVVVGPNGLVQGAIQAREVVLHGRLTGNVLASERAEIKKEARLEGDVNSARIMIEDGAYIKGKIEIVKPEPVAAAKPPAVSVASPAAAPAAPASSSPTPTGAQR